MISLRTRYPTDLKYKQLEAAGFCSPLKQQPETLASGLLWGRAGAAGTTARPALPRSPRDGQPCSPHRASGRQRGSDDRGTPPAGGFATPVFPGARFSWRRGSPDPPAGRGMPAQGRRREPGQRQHGPARPAPPALPQGHSRGRRHPARMRERGGGEAAAPSGRGAAACPPHASAPGAAPSPTMCSPGSEWSWYPDRWSPPAAPAPSGPTRPSAPLSRPPGPLKRSLGERVTAALTLPGQLAASGAWLPGEAGGGRAGRGALPRALSARSQSALGARRGRRGGGRGRGAQEVGQRRGGAG